MHRRRSLPVLIVMLALGLTAVAPATARSPGDRSDGDAVRAPGRAQPASAKATAAYWTPARMRAAKPRAFARHRDGGFAPLHGPFEPGREVGAYWPDGQGMVYRRTGKVFFTMGPAANPQNFTCSATVISDGSTTNGRSLVLTAAHCVWDDLVSPNTFARNWLFIPQFDSTKTTTCGATTYGCWPALPLTPPSSSAKQMWVHSGYTTAPGFDLQAVTHDFAVVGVGPVAGTGNLDATVGSFRLGTGGVAGEKRYAFGYPAKFPGSTSNLDLVHCAGRMFEDAGAANLTWGMRCDMTGGASGGPWLRRFDPLSGVGVVASLNSYGYDTNPGFMFGPKFDARTLAVFNAARAISSTRIVP